MSRHFYPDSESINVGSATEGTFPDSLIHSDDEYRAYEGDVVALEVILGFSGIPGIGGLKLEVEGYQTLGSDTHVQVYNGVDWDDAFYLPGSDSWQEYEVTKDQARLGPGVRLYGGAFATAYLDVLRLTRGGGSDRRRRSEFTDSELKEEEIRMRKGIEHRYITYPAAGSTASITKGDLVIDFWEGKVELPNGKEDKLSDKLNGSGHDHIRAVFLEANQDVVVQLDGGGKYTFPANTLRGIVFQPFTRLRIGTTTTTTVKLFASTDPRAGIVG